MKLLYYILLLMSSFQSIKGQSLTDSIVFHGNIVNDGIANWFGLLDEDEFLPIHTVRLKNNSKSQGFVGGTYDNDTHFSIKCMRGDTIIVEGSLVFPFSYCVEFVANDTIRKDIHVFAYPATTDNWYYHGEKYKKLRLKSPKKMLPSELAGTYKYLWKDYQCDDFAERTLKLRTDSIFEMLGHGWYWDVAETFYYTGNWEVSGDTVICRVVPELFPSMTQERYPGQIVTFSRTNWMEELEDARQQAIVYKFLIRKRGLVDIGRDKRVYKKVKL